MKIGDLAGKNVCVLGFGREGKAIVAALEKHAPGCAITIADESDAILVDKSYETHLGRTWLDDLDAFDVLIKSPGIPLGPRLKAHGSKLTSSTRIFLDTIEGRGAVTIGVTGSKGKSTTASLIHAILKSAKKDVLLLGNIGDPAIAHLDDVKRDTIVVMEMSSYQLADLTVSPHIAVVTSFFPDHLDHHGSLEAYAAAKTNIARHQTEDDMLFFNESNRGTIEIAKEGRGRKIPFSAGDAPVAIEETHLIGEHNLSNIAAAAMVTHELGVSEKTIVNAVKEFRGLPHRLESLGTHHGILWIDDAISTTPESTIAGLHALNGRVRTIILGGLDRGYAFDELAKELVTEGVTTAILFPGSGSKIRSAIERADTSKTVELHDAATMEEAVALAVKNTPAGGICLLSTASPSYGLFKNFEDKGDRFKRCILNGAF